MKALLELEARDLPRANEAARLLRLERSGFSHRFARDFGLSWTKLLRQARTEFGTEFRRGHPGVPVKSLARVTGYSETGLYRVFREVRRETPSGKRVVRQQTRVSSVPLRRPVAHIRSSRRLRTVG